MLANALRKRGYATVVAPEDGNGPQQRKRVLPSILAYTALWSFGTSAALAVGAPWYLWPIAILATLCVILWLNRFDDQTQWIGAVVILGWVILGVAQLIEGSFETLTITYLAPLLLGAAYGFATRVLRLQEAQDLALALGGVVKSAPLIAPVVLVVLFLPALSADVWQVANELDPTSLLIVGAASVGLLFLVVRLQLGSETEQTLELRALQLCDLSERTELMRRQLAAASSKENDPLLETMADNSLEEAWPAAGEEYAPYLHAAGGDMLRSPLTGRLALTVGVVGVLFSTYIYVLCSAVVPAELAAEWTGARSPATQIELPGLTVTLHGGAFLNLAALLGLAATATFLSFALIEERFAKALAGALLQDPLLSVSQVARMWGTGLDIVVELVASRTLPSLDRGELISKGQFDVPLIRRSWAEFLSLGGDASPRIVKPPQGDQVHPAFTVALDFHSALGEGDAAALYRLSSRASREGRDPDALYACWIEYTQGGFPTDSGVGSTIYTLAPLPALAARVFADAPKVPRALTRSAPARLLAVLPLVEEEGEWKVDLPLFEGPAFLPEVLTSPLPEEASRPTEDQGEGG